MANNDKGRCMLLSYQCQSGLRPILRIHAKQGWEMTYCRRFEKYPSHFFFFWSRIILSMNSSSSTQREGWTRRQSYPELSWDTSMYRIKSWFLLVNVAFGQFFGLVQFFFPQTVCPHTEGFSLLMVQVKAGAWSRCSFCAPAFSRFPVNFRVEWLDVHVMCASTAQARAKSAPRVLLALGLRPFSAKNGSSSPGARYFSCKFSR